MEHVFQAQLNVRSRGFLHDINALLALIPPVSLFRPILPTWDHTIEMGNTFTGMSAAGTNEKVRGLCSAGADIDNSSRYRATNGALSTTVRKVEVIATPTSSSSLKCGACCSWLVRPQRWEILLQESRRFDVL